MIGEKVMPSACLESGLWDWYKSINNSEQDLPDDFFGGLMLIVSPPPTIQVVQ